MGSFALRAVVLAVIALLCIWPSTYAAKRDSELVYSSEFSYVDNDGSQSTGGVFLNITDEDNQGFMWSKFPGVAAILTWDVNDLVSGTSGSSPSNTATNFSIGGNDVQYFQYGTTDGEKFYFMTQSYALVEVAPSNLTKDESAVSAVVILAGSGPLLHLRNGTEDIWVSASAPDAYSVVTRDDMGTDPVNPPSLPPIEGNLGVNGVADFAWIASCQVTSSYGYLMGTTKSSIYMYRVNASDAKPTPAIILRDVYIPPNAAGQPCQYIEASDTLYLAVVNASIAAQEGANVLVKISNWTLFDTGSEVAYNNSLTSLITASENAQITSTSSAKRDEDQLTLCLTIDEDGTLITGASPVALNIDEAGGQALLVLNGGTVVRINIGTMTTSSPALVLSGGSVLGAGSSYYTPSITDRILIVFGSNAVWKYQMASACPNDCGDSLSPPTGFCISGICECVEGRHGEDCSGIECNSDCGEPLGRGNCSLAGVCICAAEWTGANCTQRRCPNDCYDNGECDTSDYTCSCNSLWTGADCSIAAFTACGSFNTERECVSKLGACGWCADTKKCVTGNLDGPYQGSCRAWYAGGKYQVGLLIAAIIVIVIFFLMLFVGILSAMPIDYVTASILADSSLLSTDFLKEAYLRDERSAKTWKMFDLFQFISYYSFINVSFPTQMIQFSRYFNWANWMLPLPYGYEDNTTLHPNRLPTNSGSSGSGSGSNGIFTASASTRSLLNAEQYANSVKVDTENIFYGTLFWYAMLVCAVLLVYAIYALILWLCLRKKEPFIKTLLLQKVFHILTRLVLIGMIPLNFTAAWHIRQGSRPHNGTIAAAIAVIIIFGILPIVFNAIVVWGKSKELIFLFLKLRFGALYSVYHYQKARFNLIVLIKKLAVALLLGFIAASSNTQRKYVYAQVFTIVAVFVIYAIVTVIIRPYLDQIHLLLDVVMSLLFALAFGIAVLHRDSPNTAGQVVWGVCLILIFVACVIAFIHSWWSMSGRNTNPKVLCGPKYGGLEEDENANNSELDAAVQIRNKKEKEAALAGAMPANKAAAAHPAVDEDEDVDSSLQSSSSEPEDDESSSSERSESSEEEEESDE